MAFNIFSSSQLSYAKPSFHPTNIFQFPFSFRTPAQSHQVNNKHAIGRIFEQYSFALSNGIKPVPPPLQNRFIHTRLETGYERLMNMSETLERTKSELKAMRRLREVKKKKARTAKDRSGKVTDIEMEESRKELEDLKAEKEYWRGVSNNHEDKMFKMGEDVLKLINAALTSAKAVQKVTAEREEARTLLARERRLAQWAENRRHVAMFSLRRRSKDEKKNLQHEVKELQEAIRNKDRKIAELNEFCEDSIQQMEEKDRQIALHESSEVMDSFSHAVSCTLSEMSEVVLLRQKDKRTLGEKMRVLHDAVTDLVSEVKSGRDPSDKMT